MIALPEGRAGRLLALGIGGVLAGAIYLAAVAPLAALYERRNATLEDRQAFLARVEAASKALPALRAEVERWRARTPDGSFLLAGASDAIAAASLQSILKDAVERHGAKLGSAEILPAETGERYNRVRVRVGFSADLAALTAILRDVEGSQQALFVENFDIRRGDGVRGGDEAALTVSLEIYGLRRL